MHDDEPEDESLRRSQLVASALAEKLQSPEISDEDRTLLESELERANDAIWESRQRLFDQDATGQDEEVFYERFGLSGESYRRNDAGEYVGLM